MLRDLLWEFSVSRDFGQIMMSSAKSLPFREVGGVGMSALMPSILDKAFKGEL
jgi:hypothetical protein